jgi:hypothetical protein
MRSFRFFLPVIALVVCHAARAQSPSYGLGKTPAEDEIRAWDISISPTGKELPPGHGTAKEGAQVYTQKCSICHGATGSEGPAPMVVKRQNPPANPGPCLSPCIRDANVMAMHAPYATVIWDFINRGMPFKQEGSLKPDEVYALTAFILYKNGVIGGEDDVLDQQSLPKVKMPNADGAAIPDWKPGMPRPFSPKP